MASKWITKTRIRELRLERGLSQKELSDLTIRPGRTRPSVSVSVLDLLEATEHDSSISMSCIDSLARALKVQTLEIYQSEKIEVPDYIISTRNFEDEG